MGRDLLANPGIKGRSTAPAQVFCTDIARMAWPWSDDPTVTMWEFLNGDRWIMLRRAAPQSLRHRNRKSRIDSRRRLP